MSRKHPCVVGAAHQRQRDHQPEAGGTPAAERGLVTAGAPQGCMKGCTTSNQVLKELCLEDVRLYSYVIVKKRSKVKVRR